MAGTEVPEINSCDISYESISVRSTIIIVLKEVRMKFFSLIVGLLVLLPLHGSVYASASRDSGKENPPEINEELQSDTGAKVENRNEVKTMNEGEDSQLQVQNEENESFGEMQGTPQGMPKNESPRSEAALGHMSVVAGKVEELLTLREDQGGIGAQVSEIARNQVQSQVQTELEISKIDARSGLLKTIIGPDYKSLKNMNMIIEQNRMRITQLEQLMNQLENEGDTIKVQETVQALTEQNTALQERVALEEQTGSLLGWLFRMLAR